MKVSQISLLVAAIALLKVNTSWGQDVVATTAAGIDSASGAGVPDNAAVVPVRKEDSLNATGVIPQAKRYPGYGGGNFGPDGGSRHDCYDLGPLERSHGKPYYVETYVSVRGCFREDFDSFGCKIIKDGSIRNCSLSTGGIIAILLGLVVLFLLAALVLVIFMAKNGKFVSSGQNGGGAYNAGGPMAQAPSYMPAAPGGLMPQGSSPMQFPPVQSPAPMQSPVYMLAPGGPMPMQGSPPMQAPTGPQ